MQIEALISSTSDAYTKLRNYKVLFSGSLCFIMFLGSLFCVTNVSICTFFNNQYSTIPNIKIYSFNGHLPRISHHSWGLCMDLLTFTFKQRKTSARRPSGEGCATSNFLKSGPLPPNEVGKIAQHVREEKGRKGTTFV